MPPPNQHQPSVTINGVKFLVKSWDVTASVTPEDLAEVKMLHPGIGSDLEFKAIVKQVEAQADQAFGLPVLLGGSEMIGTTTTASAPTKEMFDKALQIMRDFKAVGAISRRLHPCITDNRLRVAELLELAGRVFEHNLRQIATLHGMRQRF